MTNSSTAKRIKKQLLVMIVIVIGMFGFCYALVPMYTVFCKITGLNGKTGGKTQATIHKVDKSRTVTVELITTLNEALPGEFEALNNKYSFHPGEYVTTSYRVKNLTDKPMVVQAIPSVTPGLAASHIHKIECFCFQKQPLLPQETKEMKLTFTVSPQIPTTIQTLTLAYTLFDVTP